VRRRRRGEASELDAVALIFVLPSLLYVLLMFVYLFLHGIYMSLRPPKVGGTSLANYIAFFSDEWQYRTVWITFSIAVPNTIVVVAVALLLAYGMRRGIWLERTVTTILVLPISLGVILLAEGILGFYGGRGWFNQNAGGRALLQHVRGRGAPRLLRGCHGLDLHDDADDPARGGPALRPPHPDGLPPGPVKTTIIPPSDLSRGGLR